MGVVSDILSSVIKDNPDQIEDTAQQLTNNNVEQEVQQQIPNRSYPVRNTRILQNTDRQQSCQDFLTFENANTDITVQDDLIWKGVIEE